MALAVGDDEAHLLHLDLGLHLTALLERTTGPVDAACAWCESVGERQMGVESGGVAYSDTMFLTWGSANGSGCPVAPQSRLGQS